MPPAVAPLSQEPLTKSAAQLVAQACGRAAQVLGLSKEELSAVVGKHRTTIDRTGLDPKTKEGELALLLLRASKGSTALPITSMPYAADCGAAPLSPLRGAVHRITDRQGESGTADLVDGLREQARLEQLIEGVKPPIPSHWPEAGDGRPLPSHRLLLTPFRYLQEAASNDSKQPSQ